MRTVVQIAVRHSAEISPGRLKALLDEFLLEGQAMVRNTLQGHAGSIAEDPAIHDEEVSEAYTTAYQVGAMRFTKAKTVPQTTKGKSRAKTR
jgi:hypothetical protein